MMDFDEIRKYWEDRASGDASAQSTTQDFYLREIEANALTERIGRHLPGRVADVGCGDGRTTARLAARFPQTDFVGFDYSPAMIENARTQNATEALPNLRFAPLDICEGLPGTYDLVYTTRCLINLPTWELQQQALRNLHAALAKGGRYLMVENFIEGQDAFNQVRKAFNLPEIPVRPHNLFFHRARLSSAIQELFTVDEEVNISSTYYLVSRVIYSRLCAESGAQPDYFNEHHRFAAGLPFAGEFGPVRLVSLNKR